ncbi:MAG: hypothetical protein ABI604_19845 [Nitrospirota bacterium]
MKRHVSALATPRRFKTWAMVLLAVYPLLVVLAAACPFGSTFDSHHHTHERLVLFFASRPTSDFSLDLQEDA